MSLFSRLFGGGSKPSAPNHPTEAYNGYTIQAAPVNNGGQWRVGAIVEKEIDGDLKSHHLIRADTVTDAETAASLSVTKAKQVIDAMGDSIFNA